jgi:serine/threonine protein kinase
VALLAIGTRVHVRNGQPRQRREVVATASTDRGFGDIVAPDVIGTSIGSYRILAKLGEGGMGAVYAAEHTLLGRKAAIKVLLPELSRRAEVVERFFNEARASTAIGDLGVVQIFDFGHHVDGSAFIVMELLEGESLDARMRRVGVLPVRDALRIVRQMAQTLATVHARGVIHRDLKPDNVFLVTDPEAEGGERSKILDFGIAKLTEATGIGSQTRTGSLMGTPLYMSPEQCRGAGAIDRRSDVYALGCVLFHLLCGRPPFEGEGAGDILVKHITQPAPAPSMLRPGLHAAVDALVLRCLAKSPAERFDSMNEVVAAVASAQGQLTGGALTPHDLTAAAVDWRRLTPPPPAPTTLGSSVAATATTPPPAPRRAWLVAVGGLAVVAAVVAVAIATGGGGTSPAATPPVTPSDAAASTVPVAVPSDAAAPDAVEPTAAELDAAVVEPVIAVDAGVEAQPETRPKQPRRPRRPKTEEDPYAL